MSFSQSCTVYCKPLEVSRHLHPQRITLIYARFHCTLRGVQWSRDHMSLRRVIIHQSVVNARVQPDTTNRRFCPCVRPSPHHGRQASADAVIHVVTTSEDEWKARAAAAAGIDDVLDCEVKRGERGLRGGLRDEGVSFSHIQYFLSHSSEAGSQGKARSLYSDYALE
jgi:hypothetical protein